MSSRLDEKMARCISLRIALLSARVPTLPRDFHAWSKGERGASSAQVLRDRARWGAFADRTSPVPRTRSHAFLATLLGAACVLGLVPADSAHAQLMVVGVDRKFDGAGGKRETLEPGHDELLLFDLMDPAQPALIGQLPLENSIVGPPTNIAITPSQKLALVASAVHAQRKADGSGWENTPANELFVVDLTARPIKVINAIKVGAQPSGLAINRAGTIALVANRAGKSISVLSIRGNTVTVTETLPMDDTVNAVAIAPDGRHALATKLLVHKVAQLSITPEGRVTNDKRDLPVGLYPWNVAITPDGRRALVNNMGAEGGSDGNVDTVTVIDLANDPARVVQHVTVGDAPEGLAITASGTLAVVTLLQGSYDAPPGAWFRHEAGRVVVLKLGADSVSVAGGSEVGGLPESVGISPDGRYVYVGNFANSTLSVLTLGENGAVAGRHDMPLPGPPASLRVVGQ